MPKIEIKDEKSDKFRVNQSPILLFAGKVVDEHSFYAPPQVHDDYCEILYIISGSGEFLIGGKLYQVNPGDIIIYNQGVHHEERSREDDPFQIIYCGLTNVHIEGLSSGKVLPSYIEPVLNSDPYSQKVESYLSEILQECRSQVLGYETMCSTLLMSLITLIYRLVDAKHGFDAVKGKNEITYRTKEFIDRNYTRNLSLQDIADTFYVNRHYLSHLFRKDMGDSPINYMIHRRIEEAKRLLSTTDQPIRIIAASVGYENEKYFSILFKKITRLTPGQYRDMNKQP